MTKAHKPDQHDDPPVDAPAAKLSTVLGAHSIAGTPSPANTTLDVVIAQVKQHAGKAIVIVATEAEASYVRQQLGEDASIRVKDGIAAPMWRTCQ
jgi:hypothetical protein